MNINNPEIQSKYEHFGKGYNAISDKALQHWCKQLKEKKEYLLKIKAKTNCDYAVPVREVEYKNDDSKIVKVDLL